MGQIMYKSGDILVETSNLVYVYLARTLRAEGEVAMWTEFLTRDFGNRTLRDVDIRARPQKDTDLRIVTDAFYSTAVDYREARRFANGTLSLEDRERDKKMRLRPGSTWKKQPMSGIIMEIHVPKGTRLLPLRSKEASEALFCPGTVFEPLPENPDEPRILPFRVRTDNDLTHWMTDRQASELSFALWRDQHVEGREIRALLDRFSRLIAQIWRGTGEPANYAILAGAENGWLLRWRQRVPNTPRRLNAPVRK